jgi:hypothetical protein
MKMKRLLFLALMSIAALALCHVEAKQIRYTVVHGQYAVISSMQLSPSELVAYPGPVPAKGEVMVSIHDSSMYKTFSYIITQYGKQCITAADAVAYFQSYVGRQLPYSGTKDRVDYDYVVLTCSTGNGSTGYWYVHFKEEAGEVLPEVPPKPTCVLYGYPDVALKMQPTDYQTASSTGYVSCSAAATFTLRLSALSNVSRPDVRVQASFDNSLMNKTYRNVTSVTDTLSFSVETRQATTGTTSQPYLILLEPL